MKKNYTVLQDGMKECGSACLLSIIKYYGGNVSREKLLELTNTTKDGTNFYNLLEAANEIGLSAKGYKVDDISKLYEIETPFISQVVIDNYTHFIVVYKMHNQKITIMDPAKGMRTISLEEFTSIWHGYILILEPYKKLPIYEEDNYLYRLIRNIIMNNKKLIINIILLTLIVIIFTCLYSYHFKILIDHIISTNKLNLITVTAIFIIILAIKLVVEYLRNNLLLYLNQKIDLSVMTTTTSKIISLPYSYYKNKTTGEMITRINDLLYIKNIVSKVVSTIILDMLLSLIVLIILYIINKTMTSLLFIVIIFYFLIFLIYKKHIKNMTNNIQENSAKVNSLLVESISSYETIKGLNLEERFKNKINFKYLDAINSNLDLTKTMYTIELLKDLTEGIIILFVIYLGINNVMDKSMSIGSLITYNTLLYYFINPIRNSFDFYHELYYVKNSIKRINNLLCFKYEKLDQKTNLNINGNIVINNLNFTYNSKNNILKEINITIPSGNKVILLGDSGSGKSTILKILYRLYEVNRGMVYLNNYDINDFTLLDIRTSIAYISQNEFLYTDTIKNNIIMDRNISDEEFLKVCKLTYVDEIIKDNMMSYNLPLEENGVNLSGGQRQRIILARALLKESNIILIDEGLNEIDIVLERKILTNIFNYYQDKTIIIVSHRYDNIDLYNQVIKIEEGKIKNEL